ncbi:ATP synthase F1 subunit delta [bacterium]|nr:ATP synthase F1 subunit delta [bacterium]
MNTQITTIANNYADGIIEYAAGDIAKLGKILNDLQQIELLLQQSTDLNEVLKNPAISMEKKSEIIESVFGSEIDAHEKNFLKILIEKGRFNEFSGIILSLKNKFEDIKNEKEVTIISAVSLNEEQKNSILQKLGTRLQKKVLPAWKEDKNIIGGLVIQIDDNVIDMSLLNKIENLSKNIIK